MMNGGAPEQAVLKISNLKGFLTALHAVKPHLSKEQVCVVDIAAEGLRVRWEHDSKSIQGSLFLGHQLFAGFNCPWVQKQISLPLNVIIDTLMVFYASHSITDMVLKFPGLNEDLICEMMEESGEATSMCVYAQIDTQEPPLMRDLADYWEDPSSFFLIPGALLKQAVEDMEWAAGNGAVKLTMQQNPPSLSFFAHGPGDLTIRVPASKLTGFQCAEPEVQHAYKFKNLRMTVANLPNARDATAQTTTKVTIDTNGLMKVTHMMSLQGGSRGPAGTYNSMAAFMESQRASSANSGIVQFMCSVEDVFGDD